MSDNQDNSDWPEAIVIITFIVMAAAIIITCMFKFPDFWRSG